MHSSIHLFIHRVPSIFSFVHAFMHTLVHTSFIYLFIQVDEKWIDENELELWEIRTYREKIERDRTAAVTRRQVR